MFLKHFEKKVASEAHMYSANEAQALILASDGESNDLLDDESSLESSDGYDSEEEPCLRGMKVDEIQENDQQVCFKNYYFCFFGYRSSPLMLALFSG